MAHVHLLKSQVRQQTSKPSSPSVATQRQTSKSLVPPLAVHHSAHCRLMHKRGHSPILTTHQEQPSPVLLYRHSAISTSAPTTQMSFLQTFTGTSPFLLQA